MKLVNVYDIATFLSVIDVSYIRERQIISKLYQDLQYEGSLNEFMLKVDEQLEQLDVQVMKEIDELQSQMKENLISCHFEKDMAHYLKVMKLRMQYTEIDYVKIKLRTLLKQLGYKRRSDKLVAELNEMFQQLGLMVYKKGGILGDLSELALDEFMTIRLRSE
ncbi:hypothetical protein J0J70_01510 [Turicibacter bilis]|uniref:Uncharacterized protein n=1 Tax=Turicibacter bilis TaxID=2735723 RepID=A0A9Q9CHH0_9FIRM|nr:hypothetical protein [Turicibacter bilis]MBS3198194.1 hypothetical protein [Turicibacter bilis]UUF08730.1 hypothetical protein J0J70_01510 [Turicibacter bilis]